MIENLYLNVGVMKAGTTWLYDQLCRHPDVSFAPEKEIHYFSAVTGGWDLIEQRERIKKFFRNVDHKDIDSIQKDINMICWYANYALPVGVNDAWYQSLFNGYQGKYCADFCNLNSNLDSAGWRRVRQNFSGKLKVTLCLRDPFKRAWSHYKFHRTWTGRGHLILSDGFEGFKDLLAKEWFSNVVRYDRTIERLQGNLINDEFMILHFEEFRKAPQSSLDQLCDFLEIAKIDVLESPLTDSRNASLEVDMPEEWKDYLWDYLDPVYRSMEDQGLAHNDWLRRA